MKFGYSSSRSCSRGVLVIRSQMRVLECGDCLLAHFVQNEKLYSIMQEIIKLEYKHKS